MEFVGMEQEESINNISFNENYELPTDMMFNDSNPIFNQENQVVEQSLEQIVEEEVEQTEETQQPLYKLQNVDTETSIKNEMKQLISVKATAEVEAKSLEAMRFDVENQIVNVKTKIQQIFNKTQDLEKKVEADLNSIVQSEETLLKTNQMIELLKENEEKLYKQLNEVQMKNLISNAEKQYESLKMLGKTYKPKFEKRNEEIEALKSAENDRIANLKAELDHREDALEDFKRKYEDMKKNILYCDEEIEKCITSKDLLERKFAEIFDKRAAIETSIEDETNQFESFRLNEESRIANQDEINKERIQLNQQLEEMTNEIEQLKNDITFEESDIFTRESELQVLEEKLKSKLDKSRESLEELKKVSDELSFQHDEIFTRISAYTEINNELLTKKDALNSEYLQLCSEEKSKSDKILKQQEEIDAARKDLTKKQTEIDSERAKFEKLKHQYDSSVAVLKSLENNITEEKKTTNDELVEAREKLQFAQAQFDKHSTELKKRREYTLANSNYLKEKSETLQFKLIAVEEDWLNTEQENKTLKDLKEKKLSMFNEWKDNLSKLKSTTEDEPLKSIFKSPAKESVPKKVKFNEILSFKSITSSENSYTPVENTPLMNLSFHNWLTNDNSGDDDNKENLK